MSLSSNDFEVSSELGDNRVVCRICWRNGHIEDLLSPCLCTGSQKYVHFACIARWIQEREGDNRSICDVCQHQYQNLNVRQIEKNFIQWLAEGEDVIASILTAIVVIAFFVYILNMGCIQFFMSAGVVHNAIRYIQLVLTLFLGSVFFILLVVALIVCRVQFKEWQTSHFDTIVERSTDSRRSTLSSSDSTSLSDSSSNENEVENEDKELLSTNSKQNDYQSLC